MSKVSFFLARIIVPRIARATDHLEKCSMAYSNQCKNVLSIRKKFCVDAISQKLRGRPYTTKLTFCIHFNASTPVDGIKYKSASGNFNKIERLNFILVLFNNRKYLQ